MKEFIDKLISRLKKERVKMEDKRLGYEYESPWKDCYSKVKEIVNQLAEEYNNESVKGDLISRSALIKELNGIYLDNPYDDKEDILEKAIGIVDHFPAPYQPKGE